MDTTNFLDHYNDDISDFTTIRSLLEALARALNLINPEVEHHHEQTAYLSYMIARQLGLSDEKVNLTVYAALLHDVGAVAFEDQKSVAEIEQNAVEFAGFGAQILRELPEYGRIADVIECCQCSFEDNQLQVKQGRFDSECIRLASVVHLADDVSTMFKPDRAILNQVNAVCHVIEKRKGTEYCPEAVEAFLRLKNLEFIWLDVLYNPNFLFFFTGDIKKITLKETVRLTRLMSRIIDFRSPFTAMHSVGVSASAKRLAELSGMSGEECLMMEIAGNLHDIGKIRVPRSILEKPGKLTDEEYNVIKEHPYYTRLILMNITGFERIANWAGYHHEKLNGRGYPFHFDERVLDKGARILAVADIFSALTESRPYREGMPKEKVLAILQENVDRGEISADVVELLKKNYEDIDACRDRISREVGKRYFESLNQ